MSFGEILFLSGAVLAFVVFAAAVAYGNAQSGHLSEMRKRGEREES